MFYYKIKIFEPYEGGDNILISHDKQFTEFELSSIVMEAVDKVVEEYSKKDYSNREWAPCTQEINYFPDGLSGYPRGLFGSVLSFLKYDYGFEIIIPYEKINIQKSYLFNKEFNENNPTYLFERYKDLVLGECENCHRENWKFFDGCPVENKRRRQLEDE